MTAATHWGAWIFAKGPTIWSESKPVIIERLVLATIMERDLYEVYGPDSADMWTYFQTCPKSGRMVTARLMLAALIMRLWTRESGKALRNFCLMGLTGHRKWDFT